MRDYEYLSTGHDGDHYGRPRRTSPLRAAVRANFWVAFVLVTVVMVVWGVSNLLNAEQIDAAWGPWSARALLAPLLLVAYQAILLYASYREGNLTFLRLGAGALGFVLLLLLAVVDPLRPPEYKLSPTTRALFLYVCVSYLAFALLGGRRRPNHL